MLVVSNTSPLTSLAAIRQFEAHLAARTCVERTCGLKEFLLARLIHQFLRHGNGQTDGRSDLADRQT